MHSIIITLADLFYVEYVGLALSMTSHPLDGVHFLDAFEELHLTDKHFVLYPQLISCIVGLVVLMTNASKLLYPICSLSIANSFNWFIF